MTGSAGGVSIAAPQTHPPGDGPALTQARCCATNADCSSVHIIGQDQSSSLISVVPSLHLRSKYAHHHPNMVLSLPSVHCHLTSTITHLSPHSFLGRIPPTLRPVERPCPKSNHGSPQRQLRQRPYHTALAAHSFSIISLSPSAVPFPSAGSSENAYQTRFEGRSPHCLSCCLRCGTLSSITLHSLLRPLDRCAPPPLSMSFYRSSLSCLAFPTPLLPLLATVFTDSVVYIYCDTTDCSCRPAVSFFVLYWPKYTMTLSQGDFRYRKCK